MVVGLGGSISGWGLKKGGDVKKWSLRKRGGIGRAIERQYKWDDNANEMIINELCKLDAFY